MSASNEKADHEADVCTTDSKQKYKLLKSKLKFLVYEHEALLDDLKKAQKKLLRVSRDRSFLLDRLLTFEKVEDSSSDDDDDDIAVAAAAAAGADIESDGGGREKPATARVGKKGDFAGPEKARKREGRASGGSGDLAKKRLKTIKKPRGAGVSNGAVAGSVPSAGASAAGAVPVGGAGGGAGGAGVGAGGTTAAVSPSTGAAGVALLPKSSLTLHSATAGGGREDSAERRRPRADQVRPKVAAAATVPTAGASSTTVAVATASCGAVPPLSREEIERHLESRPRPLALEKAPLHMPAEIFSNEASSADSDDALGEEEEELDPSDDLVIDTIDTKWDA